MSRVRRLRTSEIADRAVSPGRVTFNSSKFQTKLFHLHNGPSEEATRPPMEFI